ncbi:MAG: GAF domain-containing sensor histidine kinase [Acidimicrobiia bacterium]
MADELVIELPRLRAFFDGTLEVTSHLTLAKVQREVLHQACVITCAQHAALALLDSNEGFAEFVFEGVDAETVSAIGALPTNSAMLRDLRQHPDPVRVEQVRDDPRHRGFPMGHPAMGALLTAPIRIRGQQYAVLFVANPTNGPTFTDADELLLGALASAAAVAIENAQLHEKTEKLAVIGERERLARDLHDRVIQRIFATAMSLDALSAQLPETLRGRLAVAVDELDDTIREIRSTIFELARAHLRGLEIEIREIVDELQAALDVTPALVFSGPVDVPLTDDVRLHALAAAREMLTNVAKHAHATTVSLHAQVGDALTLTVRDDGVGLPVGDELTRSGLSNLQQRAELLGGTCTVTSAATGGTTAIWTVPLH